jgi:hypothetical protein
MSGTTLYVDRLAAWNCPSSSKTLRSACAPRTPSARKPRVVATLHVATSLESAPFAEDDAVRLTLAQMKTKRPDAYRSARKVRYPGARKTCDLALGDLPEWAIEIKLARIGRDNGTHEDAAVKKLLSPI